MCISRCFGACKPVNLGFDAGMALGMVTQLPEEADEHSVTRRQLLAKLDVAMGGRVAEELIFGESDVTTGASSDLEQVRRHSSCVLQAKKQIQTPMCHLVTNGKTDAWEGPQEEGIDTAGGTLVLGFGGVKAV